MYECCAGRCCEFLKSIDFLSSSWPTFKFVIPSREWWRFQQSSCEYCTSRDDVFEHGTFFEPCVPTFWSEKTLLLPNRCSLDLAIPGVTEASSRCRRNVDQNKRHPTSNRQLPTPHRAFCGHAFGAWCFYAVLDLAESRHSTPWRAKRTATKEIQGGYRKCSSVQTRHRTPRSATSAGVARGFASPQRIATPPRVTSRSVEGPSYLSNALQHTDLPRRCVYRARLMTARGTRVRSLPCPQSRLCPAVVGATEKCRNNFSLGREEQ